MSAGAASLGPGQAPGALSQDCPFGACSRVLLLRPVSPPGFGDELCAALRSDVPGELLLSWGAEDVGAQRWGRGDEARCLV